MNERTTNSGPNVGLLLLIPAAALVARAAVRHHRMLWDEGGVPGGPDAPAPYARHGHGFAGPGWDRAARDGFRMPPRIEARLEAWHARAHAAKDAPGTTGSDAPAATPGAAPEA